MSKMSIMNKIGSKFTKAGLIVRKNSPEILIVCGIGGMIVSTVMACKATTKISVILDDAKEAIEHIKEYSDYPDMEEKYSENDAKKDLAIVYIQTGVKLVKVYAPAVAVGVLSVTSILASNDILKKRNVALAAAYTAVDTGFKEYRNRVVERFGEEVDRELRYNTKKVKVEETIIDENGKEKKVKSTVSVTNINEANDYARYFDKTCSGWEKDKYYNETFLRAQQAYANDKLKAKGILFLNEVYDMLGIKWSKAGQVVGWKYDSNNDIGDNFVDFRIQEVFREVNVDGETKHEKTILLDFNVDGNVWDLM